MTPEIRLEAVKIASAIHQDVDSIINSAERLVGFITGHGKTPADAPAQTGRGKKSEQTQPAAAAAQASSPVAPASEQSPAASSSTLEKIESAVKVTVQDVTKAVIALAGKSREEAVKILQKFGANKVPELKPESLPSVHKELTAKLAELTANKAS